MSWRDRLLGIALGLVLGAGIVAAFVFAGSEHTIDAPLLSTDQTGHGAGHGGHPRQPPVATVRVLGGAPPQTGPVRLHYGTGEEARLQVVSDQAVVVELTGYGIRRTVEAGSPTQIDFKAGKPGNFALIVTPSHIAVAQLAIG
jgi:hypothetical protein